MLVPLGELPSAALRSGTGLNADPGFAAAVIARVAERLDLPLTEAPDHFEAQGPGTSSPRPAGCVGSWRQPEQARRGSAVDVVGSGGGAGRDPPSGPPARQLDHAGQGEPGAARGDPAGGGSGVRQRRRGGVAPRGGELRAQRDAAGHGRNLLRSTELLANVSVLLADRCVDGITADVARARRYAESSSAIVTALVR